MTRARPCPVHTCPNLKPCAAHPDRPASAPWSKDRDTSAHLKLRRQVIKARGATCQRCGWQAANQRGKDLQIHHVRPGNTPADILILCRPCHRAVDGHAR